MIKRYYLFAVAMIMCCAVQSQLWAPPFNMSGGPSGEIFKVDKTFPTMEAFNQWKETANVLPGSTAKVGGQTFYMHEVRTGLKSRARSDWNTTPTGMFGD